MRKVITILFLTFFVLSSAFFFGVALTIWLATVWWDRRLALLHQFTCFWGHLYIWVMPGWDVTIIDRAKLKDRPMVIVSNHQSLLDILVAFGLFSHFKWVSKAEIFKLPFIGWNMSLNRYIRLVRGDKESGKQMLQACDDTLKSGSSIYLFPEGTRSKTGEMRDFKPGAFIMAHNAKVPIQPIALNGTQDALPKHSLEFHGHHPISLKVLDPIPYERFADLSIEETSDLVRGILAAEVERLRAAAKASEAPPEAALSQSQGSEP